MNTNAIIDNTNSNNSNNTNNTHTHNNRIPHN